MKKFVIMLFQEGASGVEYIGRVKSNYNLTRLMNDAKIVADTLSQHGAKVYICDTYGRCRDVYENTSFDNAEKISARLLETLTPELDGAIFVGAHAMNGAKNAFASYTFNDVAWFEYRLNGKEYGDIGIVTTFFGAFGVPVVGISGDSASVAEAVALLGDEVATAIVKEGTNRNFTNVISVVESEKRIKTMAENALSASVSPYKVNAPYRVSVTFSRVDYCDDCMMYNIGVAERVAPLVAEKLVDEIHTIQNLLM